MKQILENLQKLQNWRNQIMGLGIVPPDVSDLIKQLPEMKQDAAALSAECAKLRTMKDGLQSAYNSEVQKWALERDRVRNELNDSLKDTRDKLQTTKDEHERYVSQASIRKIDLEKAILNKQTQLDAVTKKYDEVKAEYDAFLTRLGRE